MRPPPGAASGGGKRQSQSLKHTVFNQPWPNRAGPRAPGPEAIGWAGPPVRVTVGLPGPQR